MTLKGLSLRSSLKFRGVKVDLRRWMVVEWQGIGRGRSQQQGTKALVHGARLAKAA